MRAWSKVWEPTLVRPVIQIRTIVIIINTRVAKVARTAFAKKFGQKVEALTAFIEFYMEDSLPLSRFARKSYVFVAISVHFDDAVDC